MLKINKDKMNMQQTLECGQVFSYKKTAFGFCIYSADRLAIAIEHADYYEILTPSPEYFAHYFDLETDYNSIKNRLKSTFLNFHYYHYFKIILYRYYFLTLLR